MNARTKRLQKVTAFIESLPLAPGILDAAFERFCATGVLPKHNRIAEAVVDCTLWKDDDANWEAFGPILRVMKELAAAGQLDLGPPSPPTARERLLREAIDPSASIRRAARRAVRALVAARRRLTDPRLLDDLEPSDGPAGVRVLALLDAALQH